MRRRQLHPRSLEKASSKSWADSSKSFKDFSVPGSGTTAGDVGGGATIAPVTMANRRLFELARGRRLSALLQRFLAVATRSSALVRMCGIYRCWGRCIGTDKISTHISRGGVVRRACRAHRRVSRRALGLTRGTRPPTRQPALSAHGGPRGQSEQPRVVLHVHQPQPGLFVAQPLDKRCRVARSSRRLQRRVLEGRAGQTIGRKGVEEVLPRRSAGAADEHMRAAPHRLGAAACHAHGELRRVQHLAREQQVARRQRRVAADVVDVGAVKLERHLGRRRADVPQAFDRH
eukprot:1341787-Prymnesium_polylepis.1